MLWSNVSIWAASWQNQRNGMCAQRRLGSAWASTQADLRLRLAHMPFCWFCHYAAHMMFIIAVTIEAQKCLCNLIYNNAQAQAACRYVLSISSQSRNLDGRRGTTNTFPPFPALCCPQGISKPHSCPSTPGETDKVGFSCWQCSTFLHENICCGY